MFGAMPPGGKPKDRRRTGGRAAWSLARARVRAGAWAGARAGGGVGGSPGGRGARAGDARDAPILLMSYLNPIMAHGFERFAADASRARVAGLIVPDLPLEESDPLRDALDPAGIALVQLVTPATPTDRLERVCAASRGFVYAVTSLTENPYVLIVLMVMILIAAGCVMETTPNIVILAPILKPLADSIGMNEIQFCIMMITSLGVGFITPPLGLNLFVVSGLTGDSILKIAARAVPFVFFMLIVTLLIAYVPAVSTTLLPDTYR